MKRYGLIELYRPDPASSALVDLVFVHGLNGEPYGTWTSETNDCLWPRDLLPSVLEEEKVRILAFGYDADVNLTLGEGKMNGRIYNHAESFIAELAANRRVCISCSHARRLG